MKARALVVAASVFLSVPLLAQDTSTPFHAGQWAAQFTGGFSSFGVLKFRSPTRALVLDVRVSGGHREDFVDDSLAGMNSGASIDVRLGRRVYHPVAEKIVALHSLGVLVGYDHFATTTPVGSSSSNGWAAGPFVELGGVYLLTPHFGIGATGTASATYSRASGGVAGGTKTKSWQLAGNTAITFTATLFF